MNGPFELVRHAHGHLVAGNDTDRRIALIGFDNAIEVCVDVFLRLHPRQRGGLEFERDRVDKAGRNYFTKLEFLDEHVAKQGIKLKVPFEAVLWYHQLRNELYHSGNGMVPEILVVEGSRDAAISVFAALFQVDISPHLNVSSPQIVPDLDTLVTVLRGSTMDFLGAFIEFEKTFRAPLELDATVSTRGTTLDLWRVYQRKFAAPATADTTVKTAISLRNRVAHFQEVDSEQLAQSADALRELTYTLHREKRE